MASPATITLRCPFCSEALTASRVQSISANRIVGGAVSVVVTLNYNTNEHDCPSFPADVSASPEKSQAKRKVK